LPPTARPMQRWVEAEQRLKETPRLYKTPSGYVQQSPWLAIANKQLELMGRYMVELGMTPASRSRVAAEDPRMALPAIELRAVDRTNADADAFVERIKALASRQERPQ
jgi:P27 family predicted phage terminase small subunit